jgi:uncharacterized protein YgbK (DUF1537 family)
MIVVIADDLTGAAELGGLALRYGLTTEVTTRVNASSTADLLIIATDTRSLPKAAAEAVVQEVSAGLEQLRPRLVFKKIDSVLRGHVLAEINIQKARLNLQKALIVPANPGLGRTVVDGTYLLHGRPLHLSSFSQDPEFPISSSLVPQMLYAREGDIHVLKTHETMPETGVVVGEVKDTADLAAWCNRIDAGTLVAGAAEFFTAILESLDIRPAAVISHAAALQYPALMICGSAFHKSRSFTKEMAQNGFPVSYMPASLPEHTAANELLFKQWMNDTLSHLKKTGKAAIAVHHDIKDKTVDALAVRTIMAEAAAYISGRMQLNELLVEGGATAAAVIRKLEIETLYPVAELAPGVTRMQVKEKEHLFLTLKPGSYEWPPSLL